MHISFYIIYINGCVTGWVRDWLGVLGLNVFVYRSIHLELCARFLYILKVFKVQQLHLFSALI